MQKTTFKIQKMDCPSEEQIIRMALDGLTNIQSLEFDIPNRLLHVYHTGENEPIFQRLDTLKFDTSILATVPADNISSTGKHTSEKKTLWAVLLINFLFFSIEIVSGLISKSMGLIADSLDMLADSIVYGLALMAVGGTVVRKKNTAKLAGYFQLILAIIGLTEVVRRFIGAEKMPDFQTMIIVSVAALIANVVCLYLLHKSKSKEAHMQASIIFTSNDIMINTGVIAAALLVNWLGSGYPDLIVGAVIFVIVARGAYSILQLSK
jgi:Co/Zn/Cd efflux system component